MELPYHTYKQTPAHDHRSGGATAEEKRLVWASKKYLLCLLKTMREVYKLVTEKNLACNIQMIPKCVTAAVAKLNQCLLL